MWKVALGECTLTAFIFTLYNFSSSFGVFLRYTSFNSWFVYVSLAEILVYFAIMSVILWLYISKQEIWVGQFKAEFNSNNFSKLYYLIPILSKFVIGTIIGLGNSHYLSGIISILILLADIIIVALLKPYIDKHHNIRSLIHNSISSLILIFYIVLSASGPSKSQGPLTYFPYIILAFIIMNVSVGAAFIIYQFILDKKMKNNKILQYKH